MLKICLIWQSKAFWDQAFSWVDCSTCLVLHYSILGFFDISYIIYVTIDFEIFIYLAIFEYNFLILYNINIIEIVSSEYFFFSLLNFKNIMIIGCKFAKWEKDKT